MLITDCRIGMEVMFGRGNGEQTRGVIEKLNRAKAKIRTTENRGRTTVGTLWNVPYSLMTPIVISGVSSCGTTTPPAPVVEISYHPFQDRVEQTILEAINMVYNELSPESLTCDGELSTSQINAKRVRLNRQLQGLFKAIGRTVDEEAAFNWWRQKQDYKNKIAATKV